MLSLQHDGVVVALQGGTGPDTAAHHMSVASSAAVGYEQPSEVKPPELPEGIQRPDHISREVAQESRRLSAGQSAC